DGLAGLAGPAFAGDHDGADPELVQRLVDAVLAVAAVSGDRPRAAAGARDDPGDGRRELRCVGWVAGVDGVVEHDTVVVVDDLRFAAELHRHAQAAFAD